MSTGFFWASLAVMGLVVFAIRAVPLLLLRREIKNPYIKAFLTYVPYATLTAMAVPQAFYAVPHLSSGITGIAIAAILAFCRVSLLWVAIAASLAVGIMELLIA